MSKDNAEGRANMNAVARNYMKFVRKLTNTNYTFDQAKARVRKAKAKGDRDRDNNHR